MSEAPVEMLEIVRVEDEPQSKGSRLAMEGIPVSPESKPYLVSGSRRFLWVRQERETLSAAFRSESSLEEVYPEIVEAIEREGSKRDWGNLFTFTEEGVKGGVEYLRYFGIWPVEILISSSGSSLLPEGEYQDGEGNAQGMVHHVEWLPPGYAIVVPSDKAFLGTVIYISQDSFAVVVHNPSRGIAILRDLPEVAAVDAPSPEA